jgi:integrase
MAEFTLATGLRENNVLRLDWSQVDLKRRVAWIHPDQAKGGQAIAVPLNAAAVVVLKERGGKRKGWVFGCPEPYWQASNKSWYAALKVAKLEGFRWHDLRHTWASWAVMSGVSLAELKELGGWKTAALVNRYAHLSAKHLAGAAAKIKPPVA